MKCEKCCDVDVVLELLQKRQPFLTPQNSDFARCVRIMPCDVVRLQQEGYQAGRSSFLQHAFYQYRHLLLAVTPAGEYVLGVPGIQNPQERYMAEMFGYRDFRLPHICGCRPGFLGTGAGAFAKSRAGCAFQIPRSAAFGILGCTISRK